MDLTETIKTLVHLGQEHGYVTYDDINDILPDNLSPDDLDALRSSRLKERINRAAALVVFGNVLEGVQVEVPAEFAIDPTQEILVERSGHAGRIVVGELEGSAILLAVDAEQQGIAAAQTRPQPSQEC